MNPHSHQPEQPLRYELIDPHDEAMPPAPLHPVPVAYRCPQCRCRGHYPVEEYPPQVVYGHPAWGRHPMPQPPPQPVQPLPVPRLQPGEQGVTYYSDATRTMLHVQHGRGPEPTPRQGSFGIVVVIVLLALLGMIALAAQDQARQQPASWQSKQPQAQPPGWMLPADPDGF